jgi:G3E family GTPase
MTRIATHLITGFSGAGKTTLVRALLAQRPSEEHWALLLNGSGGIAGSDGVSVMQLTDGCACCSARVSFRTALVQLLRAARPRRLLIELAGAGDPAGVKVVLNEAPIARVVELHNILCVVDPRQLADARIAAHESYAAQLKHADCIVLAQANDGSDGVAARAAAARLEIPDAAITLMQDAGLSLLDIVPCAQSSDKSRRTSL